MNTLLRPLCSRAVQFLIPLSLMLDLGCASAAAPSTYTARSSQGEAERSEPSAAPPSETTSSVEGLTTPNNGQANNSQPSNRQPELDQPGSRLEAENNTPSDSPEAAQNVGVPDVEPTELSPEAIETPSPQVLPIEQVVKSISYRRGSSRGRVSTLLLVRGKDRSTFESSIKTRRRQGFELGDDLPSAGKQSAGNRGLVEVPTEDFDQIWNYVTRSGLLWFKPKELPGRARDFGSYTLTFQRRSNGKLQEHQAQWTNPIANGKAWLGLAEKLAVFEKKHGSLELLRWALPQGGLSP